VHFNVFGIEPTIALLPICSAAYLLKLLEIAACLIGTVEAMLASPLYAIRDVTVIGTKVVVRLNAPIVTFILSPLVALQIDTVIAGSISAPAFISLPIVNLAIAILGSRNSVSSQTAQNASDHGTSNVVCCNSTNGSTADCSNDGTGGMVMATASICVGRARGRNCKQRHNRYRRNEFHWESSSRLKLKRALGGVAERLRNRVRDGNNNSVRVPFHDDLTMF
jgi:hypothetical protein